MAVTGLGRPRPAEPFALVNRFGARSARSAMVFLTCLGRSAFIWQDVRTDRSDENLGWSRRPVKAISWLRYASETAA